MDVITLGTGTPIPDPNRAGPATLVQAAGKNLLFDAGRGVLMRLAASLLGPAQVDVLFLTHLHSDHITDLNDLITMRWVGSLAPSPLRIVGPIGTRQVVDATLEMLRLDIGYRLEHHDDLDWEPPVEVTELEQGVAYEAEGILVRSAPTEHSPVRPTLGFRVEAEGKVVAIGGDSIPCAGLDEICQGADVYVQTVVRRSVVEAIGLPRLLDILDYHSDLEQAGSTAERAGVGKLVLTHLVPAPPPGAEAEWAVEAGANFSGEVLVATDLLRISA